MPKRFLTTIWEPLSNMEGFGLITIRDPQKRMQSDTVLSEEAFRNLGQMSEKEQVEKLLMYWKEGKEVPYNP